MGKKPMGFMNPAIDFKVNSSWLDNECKNLIKMCILLVNMSQKQHQSKCLCIYIISLTLITYMYVTLWSKETNYESSKNLFSWRLNVYIVLLMYILPMILFQRMAPE